MEKIIYAYIYAHMGTWKNETIEEKKFIFYIY